MTLDKYVLKQFGECGQVEYGWSTCFRDKIVQFHFQLTRTNENKIELLRIELDSLLYELKKCYETKNNDSVMSIIYLRLLYKMIGHTRDIIHGKGEYLLTYMMIYTWYKYYPELALYALETLVSENPCGGHPYGSWKDIKYFCNYCKIQGCNVNHPLISHAILLVNSELLNDTKKLECGSTNISLVSKWVPREKSKKFGWLYQYLACDYFANYLINTPSQLSYDKAMKKCKMEYRKMLTHMNRIIDTVQIKQCQNTWHEINFKNVTSITMTKQKKAFLNICYNGKQRYLVQDRIECVENFKKYLCECEKKNINIKGKRVCLSDFTDNAVKLLNSLDLSDDHISKETIQLEMNILNSQWRDHATQNGSFGKMIPMIDFSSSMDCKTLHSAIALGIRVAEKSILGKRILTFGSYPEWINLDEHETFVDMVNILRNSNQNRGMNANFYAAIDMILDAIVETKMKPEDVENLVLAIFSDMQIDYVENNLLTMYEQIKQKYEITGLRLYGKPFKPPHILFWNLKSTNGFPNLPTQTHSSMFSGFSPLLLNIFDKTEREVFQPCSSWTILETMLSNPRYTILDDCCSHFLQYLNHK